MTFILSSISRGLGSVNYTSIYKNSDSDSVFKNIKFLGKISIIDQTIYTVLLIPTDNYY